MKTSGVNSKNISTNKQIIGDIVVNNFINVDVSQILNELRELRKEVIELRKQSVWLEKA